MNFAINADCLMCHAWRAMETVAPLGDNDTNTSFIRELMLLLANAPEDTPSPYLDLDIRKLMQRYYHLTADHYLKEKEDSNHFVLERLEDIRSRIQSAEDPLFAALQFSVLGNYIDFSALQGQVSFLQLDEMLDSAEQMDLDRTCYAQFTAQLKDSRQLLYIADNAGEICFDRLFAEEIKKHFPHLQITFCVRGGLAKNDATLEDAERVGIPFPIVGNGTTICGTDLNALPPEAKAAFQNADVIIAKGQGNTETLCGCGLNIYYAFLVKCPRFVKDFGKPQFTPMFVREKDLNP